MKILFEEQGWQDYTFWLETNHKIVRKINGIIKDITREPFSGIGKPEPLKHQLAGYWSRRIDAQHRLVYEINGDIITIIQCRLPHSAD